MLAIARQRLCGSIPLMPVTGDPALALAQYLASSCLITALYYRLFPDRSTTRKLHLVRYDKNPRCKVPGNWQHLWVKELDRIRAEAKQKRVSITDFRVTDYKQIQKWWELVMSAYLMVSLHSKILNPSRESERDNAAPNLDNLISKFATHDWWDTGTGWKNLLNNLRLIIQPFVLFNLLKPWLKVFPNPQLSFGFWQLIALMNFFRTLLPNHTKQNDFLFSSA